MGFQRAWSHHLQQLVGYIVIDTVNVIDLFNIRNHDGLFDLVICCFYHLHHIGYRITTGKEPQVAFAGSRNSCIVQTRFGLVFTTATKTFGIDALLELPLLIEDLQFKMSAVKDPVLSVDPANTVWCLEIERIALLRIDVHHTAIALALDEFLGDALDKLSAEVWCTSIYRCPS